MVKSTMSEDISWGCLMGFTLQVISETGNSKVKVSCSEQCTKNIGGTTILTHIHMDRTNPKMVLLGFPLHCPLSAILQFVFSKSGV